MRRKETVWGKTYYYIMKNGAFDRVAKAFDERSGGKYASRILDDRKVIIVQGATWKGYMKAEASPDGMFVYSFTISEFKERNGIPREFLGMNQALTAFEQALLSLDPMTQVGSKGKSMKTTPNFI